MSKKLPLLALIAPCYNEEEVFQDCLKTIHLTLQDLKNNHTIHSDSYIVLVDDGSTDRTFGYIEASLHQYPELRYLQFSRNFGHQSAILAGMMEVIGHCDLAATFDFDLQDDIGVLSLMLQEIQQGADLVYGVRGDRNSDDFFKKSTAEGFYRLMHWLGVDIVYNHADYRLMRVEVLEALAQYSERNLFLRGVFPDMGFVSAKVYYTRKEREAGQSKFSLLKMLSFALDGITSFSVRPLRMVTALGFIVFMGTSVMTLYTLFAFFFMDVVHGWASTVLPIYFIGGVQILCTGLVGEYIGKIYKEVKQRPRYIIRKKKW